MMMMMMMVMVMVMMMMVMRTNLFVQRFALWRCQQSRLLHGRLLRQFVNQLERIQRSGLDVIADPLYEGGAAANLVVIFDSYSLDQY